MNGIRLAQRGDGPSLRRLIAMTVPESADIQQVVDGLSGEVDRSGYPDLELATLVNNRVGISKDFPMLTTMRMCEAEGVPVGMSYCAPPIPWITERTGLRLNMAGRLAGRLAELEMLAVLPEWQARGYGGDLVEDAIARYRKAGYAALFVTVFGDSMIPWYRTYGFAFGPKGEPFDVQFWADRNIQAPYADLSDEQYVGMLPLAGHVTVDEGSPFRGSRPKITGLLD